MPGQPTGRILAGTYRLVRLIGTGGFGKVYEAQHLRLPRRFAIKILDAAAARDPRVFARFRREAEVAGSLGHPGIVEVIDFNYDEHGTPFIVMEYLEGEDLAARIERLGALGLGECVWIVTELADALDAAHQRGIVHRDLKPQNVFLARGEDGGERVELLDFGIAKIISSPKGLTRSGMIVGTVQYMAPEQARGHGGDVDGASDVFSLAAMSYRMIAGRPPFDAANLQDLLVQICTLDPPPLASLQPDLPAEVADVIAQGMARSREERFSNAPAFAAALCSAAGLDAAQVRLSGAMAPVRDAPAVRATGGGRVSPRPAPAPGSTLADEERSAADTLVVEQPARPADTRVEPGSPTVAGARRAGAPRGTRPYTSPLSRKR